MKKKLCDLEPIAKLVILAYRKVAYDVPPRELGRGRIEAMRRLILDSHQWSVAEHMEIESAFDNLLFANGIMPKERAKADG